MNTSHNGDGAMDRVPESATAFGHRGWPYNFVVTSAWAGPSDTGQNISWTRDFFEAMRPFGAAARSFACRAPQPKT